jgi:hypothetical protein
LSVLPEAWRTDEDLASARQHFAARISGYVPPAAYGVARLDGERLTFGAVNGLGHIHRLPAVVLASVCGYTSRTGTFPLGVADLREAVDRLAPAEAAVHWEHPNLWSWRELLDGAGASSTFLAFFVAHPTDAPVDDHDAAFRAQLTR